MNRTIGIYAVMDILIQESLKIRNERDASCYIATNPKIHPKLYHYLLDKFQLNQNNTAMMRKSIEYLTSTQNQLPFALNMESNERYQTVISYHQQQVIEISKRSLSTEYNQ